MFTTIRNAIATVAVMITATTAQAGLMHDALTALAHKAQEKHAQVKANAATKNMGTGFEQCAHLFPNNKPLSLDIVPAEMQPVALCFDDFAVLYSGKTKTPIVTIEKLNRNILMQAKGLKRTDRFYEEARLPFSMRSTLADYSSVKDPMTGKARWDRGHMGPAANRSNPNAMAQSFSLANMVPQDPKNNREIWSALEDDIRKFGMRKDSDIFVYTFPTFAMGTNSEKIGRNAVWVPTSVGKLMYDMETSKTYYWDIPNTSSARIGAPRNYQQFKSEKNLPLLQDLKVE